MKKYQMIKFYISRIYKNIYRFIRWGVFSAIVGIVVGSFSTLFAYCLRVVTEIRTQHPEIIFALPLGGIVIVALYGIFKYKNDKGTNLVLSTIHADKASAIPYRMYSLLESNQDIEQFLKSIHRYVQIGIHVKGYMSAELQRFQREIVEVVEFYVDENNEAKSNIIFSKSLDGTINYNKPTKYLKDYFGAQGKVLDESLFSEAKNSVSKEDNVNQNVELDTL